MKYFKNTELAKLYHISEKSVRNWIDAAQTGKLDLQLFEHNSKQFIANTVKNTQAIEELVAKGRKYKNTRGFKVISPSQKFYDTYSQEQILDIISNLTIYHEIPTVYSYADGGAKYWDEYAKRLMQEQGPNILNRTMELLKLNLGYIDQLTKDHAKINVVDLGPGNGLPIRDVLAHLLKQGKLNRYIAIDGSKEMLSILEHNIKEWFDGAVHFEGQVRDFSQERFHDLFAQDSLDEEGNAPVNLVFVLGGTLNNFRAPDMALQTIHSSMALNDIAFYAAYLDTPFTRRYFDFVSQTNQKIRSELILEHIGIDDSLYSTEQVFDGENKARMVNFYPKVDLSIKFKLPRGVQSVELRKQERVLLWRGWHRTAPEIIGQFDRNGFDVMQATKSPDRHYILLATKLKTV